jgi:hypothetical protein
MNVTINESMDASFNSGITSFFKKIIKGEVHVESR